MLLLSDCKIGDVLYLQTHGSEQSWVFEVSELEKSNNIRVYGILYCPDFYVPSDGQLNQELLNNYKAKIICKGTQ